MKISTTNFTKFPSVLRDALVTIEYNINSYILKLFII